MYALVLLMCLTLIIHARAVRNLAAEKAADDAPLDRTVDLMRRTAARHERE